MNANSNINTDLIRDSTEDDQSTLEEVTSARDIEEHQQSENETDLGNSDSEYVLSDTDLANDLEPEEERSNLELSTETGRDPEETYIPKELKKVFHDVLDANNIEIIGELLEQYPFLSNESYLLNEYFIFTAIRYCDLTVLKKFIEADLNVNLRGEDGQNILHCAVRYDKLEIVKYILDSQLIDINDTDTYINTPVHYACSLGKLKSLKLLLKYDADVTILNKARLNCLGVAYSYLNTGGNKEQYINLIQKYMEQKEAARDIEEIQRAENKLVEVKLQVRLKKKEKKIAAIGHLIEIKSELENKINEYNESEAEAIQDKIKSVEVQLEVVEKEIEEHFVLEREIFDLRKQLQEIRNGKTFSNWRSLIDLSEINSFIDDSDCPICCLSLKPPVKIYQCTQGHYFCEKCKRNHTIIRCPSCRENLNEKDIRCRVLENFMAKRFEDPNYI